MSQNEIRGGCLCGAVRYECSAAPIVSLVCHCRDCQKSSGAPMVAVLFVPRESVSIQGVLKQFSSPGSSGKLTERHFCGECGSSVFGVAGAMPQFMAICSGSLDDSSWVKPQAQCWTARKQNWLDAISSGQDSAESMMTFDTIPDFKKMMGR
ncbi:MAG: GFA family protein [Pseudomonadales bacterium]|nr:GFA family protein [Pseudomonadales bacterium]